MIFLLVTLAVWRVTHFFTLEDGPGDVVIKFRLKITNGFWGSLFDCFYCLSVWVALPFALYLSFDPVWFFIYWLALSGAACLLEQATQKEKA